MGVMMDNCNVMSKDGNFDGDIEKGEVGVKLGGVGGGGGGDGLVIGSYTTIGGLGSDFVSVKHEERVIALESPSSEEESKGGRLIVVDKKVVEERDNGDVERKVVKEKPKGMSAKKPPKPPRPPRGLSLDSADQKLIRELHELARLKRARVERMKGLKKAKEAKAMSSKNQLFATLLTILFCLVLLLQGMSSRTGTTPSIRRFRGPPFSTDVAEQHSTISIQHLPLSSTANLNRPGSASPSLVEQLSELDKAKEVGRAIGRL
ncbi:uncharacterized protein LOC141656824 [Silene latifolia]|uniref:uncharacterized protein LOC141656824 n=1 Tax=Silene latifolia TaxID=37657 RepID=UPI003D78AABC